jgi:hypothetical protein
MPAPDDRATAFRCTVIYNLGGGDAGAAPRWTSRTLIPTLASFAPVRALAARRGWHIEAWLYDDGARGPLEECEGHWRPAVGALAFAPGLVPSRAASVAAFNAYVRPLERAFRTRSKAVTHRRTILTWAVWKGVLHDLLPMSGRKRTYRELAHHLVRIQEAMLEAVQGIEFTIEQPVKPPEDSITRPQQVADYAGTVRQRVHDWWAGHEKTDPAAKQIVQTYFGEQPLSVLLERCAWHSAQHTRQLQLLLTRMSIEPAGALTAEDLKGLPLPEKVWED